MPFTIFFFFATSNLNNFKDFAKTRTEAMLLVNSYPRIQKYFRESQKQLEVSFLNRQNLFNLALLIWQIKPKENAKSHMFFVRSFTQKSFTPLR